MESRLTNEYLTVEVNKSGAELSSIKLNSDNTEYLWQANSHFWGRRAPILFPIVGKLSNDEYTYNDKVYSLTQHGFARDMDFEVYDAASDKVTYLLNSSDVTLKRYPFRFQLFISYTLDDNEVIVEYTVKNVDSDVMYFSIGAHPGFNCPLLAGENMEDYYLEFECNEDISTFFVENGLLAKKSEVFLKDERMVNLSPELFRRDAVILKGLKSNKVSLKSKVSDKAITIDYKGFPYLGIWSMPEGAPFICIEPWYGIADSVDSTGDYKTKEGILCLEPSQEFRCQYSIVIK